MEVIRDVFKGCQSDRCGAAVATFRLCVGIGVLLSLSVVSCYGNERRILRGRVHDSDTDRLSRPDLPSVGQAVRVLPGYGSVAAPQSPLMNAETEKDVIDMSLKTENFNIPAYKKMTPQPALSTYHPSTGTRSANLIDGELWNYAPDGDKLWRLNQRRKGKVYAWPVNNDWMIHKESLSGQLSSTDTGGLIRDNDFAQLPPVQMPRPSIPSFTPLPDWKPQPQPVYEDSYVSWDAWYQKVAQSMWKKWKQSGTPTPGDADLRITVDRLGKVQAHILSSTNPSESFKSSILKSASDLSGTRDVAFPPNTRKQSVTFDTHFSAGNNVHSGASSQRANELEHNRKQIR